MKNHHLRYGRPPHCGCCRLIQILYPELKHLRDDHNEIMRFILNKQEEETTYRDAKYTEDRVGISESTLLRCQHKGLISVAKKERGKKLFRDQDVERLRKEYWRKD